MAHETMMNAIQSPPVCTRCGCRLRAEAGEAMCPACLIEGVLALEDDPEAIADDEAGLPEPGMRWGGYELLEVLGRGGMGVVFRARRPGASGEVALKMIATPGPVEPDELRRFRQEAEVIGRLRHPHIVQVHETGEDDGRAWFAMQLACGGSLARRLAEHPEGLGARTAAGMMVQLARALAFAHGHGVLHRDLKPANILLEANDHPLIADFGLARLTHGPGGATLTGAAIGTPAYMAPEQAAGTSAATTASDVYGLGAVLHHMLSGRPPFEGASPLEVLRKVVLAEPPALPQPAVPRDLATVCARAMARDPGRRYRSAADLADDLERWLRGEPVLARRAAWPELVWNWARRHPAAATLAAAVAAGAVVIGGLLITGNNLLRAERNEAVHQAGRAASGERAMALNVYAADLYLARRAFEDGHLGAASDLLTRHLPGDGSVDLRGFEWHHLSRQCRGDAAVPLAMHRGAVTAVAFSPDGRTALTGGRDGALNFWNAEDATLRMTLPLKPGTPPLVDFAALASLPVRSPELPQVLRSGVSFEEVRMRARPSRLGEVGCAAWSPDGRWVATGGEGAYVRLWRAADGRLHGFIPEAHARQLGFSRDAAELVVAVGGTGNVPSEIRRHAVDTLARLETIPVPRAVFALAAGADCMAVPGGAGVVVRSLGGTTHHTWSAEHGVDALALSPDGSRVVVFGQENGTLRSASGSLLGGLDPQQGLVRSPVFSGDGALVAVGCAGQSVALFDGMDGRALGTLRGHSGEVLSVAFRPGTAQLLSGSGDQSARLWAAVAGTSPSEEEIPRRERLVAAAADASHLAGDNGNGAVVWRAADGAVATLPATPARRVLAVQGAGGDVRILTRHVEAPVLEWWHGDGRPDGGPVRPIGLPDRTRIFAAAAAGRLVAVADNRRVTLHDPRTGGVVRTLPPAPVNIESIRLSADGRLLAAREYPRTEAVADTETGQWLWHGRLTAGTLGPLAFSPDGRFMASGADDAVIAIIEARTGERVVSLREHLSEITALAFSEDGRTLASAGKDRTLRLWHAATWRPLGPLRRQGLFVSLQFAAGDLFAEEYESRWLRLRGE